MLLRVMQAVDVRFHHVEDVIADAVKPVTFGQPVLVSIAGAKAGKRQYLCFQPNHSLKWSPLPSDSSPSALFASPFVFMLIGNDADSPVQLSHDITVPKSAFALWPISKPGHAVCSASQRASASGTFPLTLQAMTSEVDPTLSQLFVMPPSPVALPAREVTISVTLDGPTRVLSIRSSAPYDDKSLAPATLWSAVRSAVDQQRSSFGLEFRIALPVISVSVVDTERQVSVAFVVALLTVIVSSTLSFVGW